MTSAAPAQAKGKLAQEAFQILVQRESRAIESVAARIVIGQLITMFGLENSEWSQDMLYDYFLLRDRVGARHLQRDLPEILESFHEQFFAITEWREDVKEYKAVMDLEPDDEVESSWLRLFTFFNAVIALKENLHQMLA